MRSAVVRRCAVGMDRAFEGIESDLPHTTVVIMSSLDIAGPVAPGELARRVSPTAAS